MKNLAIATVGTVFLALGTVDAAKAVTLIDTCGAECGKNGAIGYFGEGSPLSLGQTFTVPDTNNVLTEFSFFLSDSPSAGSGGDSDVVDFRAFVIKWDETNNTPTGSVLFESTPQSTTLQNSLYPMQEFTFNTGGINLASGTKYLAFLSSLKDLDGSKGLAWVGESPLAPSFDRYPGGKAFLTGDRDFDSIIRSSWSLDNERADLNFKATFISEPHTSVPEPSFMLSTSLALGAFAAKSLRKLKQQSASK